ncbi:MAG: FAD-binding oxidoreductase [Clostridia bacterium]|nr:FAD-binding oxidoreductase [Clostridia bacterium]
MRNTADVVIIGGGISGVSIAYNLAKRGVSNVVVLEREHLASGSTGRCGAGVRMQWGTELDCAFAKYSIDFFEHAACELGYDGDIGFKQNGYLIVGVSDEEREQFRKNVALQNALGIESKLLTPLEAKDVIPHMDESRITCATYCRRDGHLNPFHATKAYADAAIRLGAQIITETEVLSIEIRGGNKTVRTSLGDIETPVVVNAAGAYAPLIADMVGVSLPVYAERHEVLVTEPVAPLQGPMFMSFSKNIYCQQTPEGSFIMGRGDKDEPCGYNLGSGWVFLERMAGTCVELLPLLAELSVVRQWAGLYAMTPDRHPIYGGVKEASGFYLACGFSGRGFMFAPATGTVVAEAVLNLPHSLPVRLLDVERFARGEEIWEPSVV